jgi:site-specific recombinase XerD
MRSCRPRRCSGSPPPTCSASRASWEQVDGRDIQQWMGWLLDRNSSAYASNQYRALQQFFRWLAAEDELPESGPGHYQVPSAACAPAAPPGSGP